MKSPTRTSAWQRVREDPVLVGALAFALVATAHAEYTLATATHVNPWVAVAVPGALDLYVIRALARGRDVFLAVLLMVAANVTSHLIAAGVLVVGWQVISAVGALAPLLLWRIHALGRTRNRAELLWDLEAGQSEALAESGAESAPDQDEYPGVPLTSTPGITALGPWGAHSPLPEYHEDGCDGQHPGRVPCEDHTALVPSAPEYVPAEWSAPVLHLPTSPGFEPSTALQESDLPYLAGAQEYVDCTPEPTVKGLRRALKIGQARAERLLEHLGVR